MTDSCSTTSSPWTEMSVWVTSATSPRRCSWRRWLDRYRGQRRETGSLPRVPAAGEGTTGIASGAGPALPVFSDPLAFGPMGRLPVVRFERSLMESAAAVPGVRASVEVGSTVQRRGDPGCGADIAAVVSAWHWRRWHRRFALHSTPKVSCCASRGGSSPRTTSTLRTGSTRTTTPRRWRSAGDAGHVVRRARPTV